MSSTVTPMRWWHVAAVQGLEREIFPSDPWSAEQFWSELAQPTRRYLVALDGDDVLAYAGMFVLPPDADVQTVGVAPTAQGRGVARALLSRLLAGVDTDGVTHTMLEVREDNDGAKALYTRLGFDIISRRPRYYPDGADALVMRRPRPAGGA
ncbi:MAG: ribosomal protein S18-alanine N-acetyltransferase [Candidatus Nanopelagicales bacterium]|nr:ribosomal protein S18-alanine N-acetyltransferase [Candidatus Nanopelagicales bacterium]MCF8543233.1 ribosomal protein S18-alanine N-acetyltransferase [Candidatus Nanopelagicales bacterium]MCF8557117.1 ribosomal protein S18-alanine N-acetyltransferase [Candidatus Nanopelagicales bacterium]